MDKLKITLSRHPILSLDYPRMSAVNGLHEYTESKCLNSSAVYKPDESKARNSVQMDLMKSKILQLEANYALKEKRQQTKLDLKKFDEEWEEMAIKVDKLKGIFVLYNTFVRENSEKRDRASKKIADEVALNDQRRKNLEELEENYNGMYEIKKKFEIEIKALKVYEDFLSNVCKYNPNLYKNIWDVIRRHDALIDARETLNTKQLENVDAIRTATSKLNSMVTKREFDMIGMNNRIADLRIRYDRSRNLALKWESVNTKVINQIMMKVKDIEDIQRSCWSIYSKMIATQSQTVASEPIERDDIGRQLMFIKKSLQVMSLVRTKFHQ